mmetsp:Transcript_1465/g.6020  ORF Transcript_1465/g.6020 Transcript_1465/m.6020 type:complete len:316 (+) Transcript_1465:276-1223(+)
MKRRSRPPRRRRTSSPRWRRWRWTPTRTRRRSTRSCAASPPPPRARSTPSSRRRRSRSRPRGAGPSRRARVPREPPPNSDAKHPSETSGTSAPSPPRWRTTTAPSARSRSSARAWNASSERSTSSKTTPRWSAARWTEPPTNPIPERWPWARRGQRWRRCRADAGSSARRPSTPRRSRRERRSSNASTRRWRARGASSSTPNTMWSSSTIYAQPWRRGRRPRSFETRLASRTSRGRTRRRCVGTRRRVTRRTPGNGRGGRWWRSGSGSWSRPVARVAGRRINASTRSFNSFASISKPRRRWTVRGTSTTRGGCWS